MQEKFKQEVEEGKLVVEGVKDVLTLALGTDEHGGRVRGQGSHVKQSVYFDLPRQKKARSMDEKILEKVQKFMAVETPKIIKERDEYWVGEIEKLKAELSMRTVRPDYSPMHASHQASCHSKGDVADKGVGNPSTPETERKFFPVENEKSAKKVKLIDTLYVDFEEDVDEHETRVILDNDEGGYEKEDKGGGVTGDASQSDVAKLAVGSLSNIVAIGKIDEVPPVDGHEQTIHGVRLGGENVLFYTNYKKDCRRGG